METSQALDHQPGPALWGKKQQRARLTRLAQAHPAWVLGFADELWWSRLTQPNQQAWADGTPLRLPERTLPQGDPDPKAIACYGLRRTDTQPVQVCFVEGRPVSHVTTAFLTGVGNTLTADGKKARRLVWDQASWHRSRDGRGWSRAHNRHPKLTGGVRLVVGHRPIKSPGLNRLEPHWLHPKRAVGDPGRLLSKAELIRRICAYFDCQHVAQLQQLIANKAA